MGKRYLSLRTRGHLCRRVTAWAGRPFVVQSPYPLTDRRFIVPKTSVVPPLAHLLGLSSVGICSRECPGVPVSIIITDASQWYYKQLPPPLLRVRSTSYFQVTKSGSRPRREWVSISRIFSSRSFFFSFSVSISVPHSLHTIPRRAIHSYQFYLVALPLTGDTHDLQPLAASHPHPPFQWQGAPQRTPRNIRPRTQNSLCLCFCIRRFGVSPSYSPRTRPHPRSSLIEDPGRVKESKHLLSTSIRPSLIRLQLLTLARSLTPSSTLTQTHAGRHRHRHRHIGLSTARILLPCFLRYYLSPQTTDHLDFLVFTSLPILTQHFPHQLLRPISHSRLAIHLLDTSESHTHGI